MSEQSRGRPRHHDEEPDEVPVPQAADQTRPADDDLDSLLDEIDDVLETNAEEFVRSFVQKGGQ